MEAQEFKCARAGSSLEQEIGLLSKVGFDVESVAEVESAEVESESA